MSLIFLLPEKGCLVVLPGELVFRGEARLAFLMLVCPLVGFCDPGTYAPMRETVSEKG